MKNRSEDKNMPVPPKWADVFLEWYCDPYLLEQMQGDLHEFFYRRVETMGLRRAKLLYVKDVLSCLRTLPYKTTSYYDKAGNLAMFKNYLLLAYRNLSKQLSLSVIHLLGLTIGLLAFLMMGHYAAYQHSYDGFHKHKRSIYRVVSSSESAEGMQSHALSYSAIGPAAKETVAGVENFTRLFPRGEVTINMRGEAGTSKSFRQKNIFFAPPSLFDVFSFSMLEGSSKAALSDPFTIVLSERLAKKYFPNQNPVGESIQLDDQFGQSIYRVTGIFKDNVSPSHLQIEALTSYQTLSQYVGELAQSDWTTGWFYTYLLLAPGADKKRVEENLQALLVKHKGEMLEGKGTKETLRLQALLDIHLYSQLDGELGPTGNGKIVDALFGVAILIVCIAYINYINLATARAMGRAKEVGIRKTIGASRRELVWQFLSESFLLQFLALVIALLLSYLLLPILGKGLNEPLALKFNTHLLAASGALVVIGTLAAGLYPALLLSAFKPVSVLRGKVEVSFKDLHLRKGLVVAQFVAAIVLVGSSYVVHKQLQFMLSERLGIDLEQILVVRGPAVHDSLLDQKLQSFKTELLTHPQVNSLSVAQYLPGTPMEAHGGTIRRMEAGKNDYQFHINSIDEDFLETFGVKLLWGRNFSKNVLKEEEKVLINEKAATLLGFSTPEQALGRKIFFPYGGEDMQGGPVEIIGVVADYHHLSLKELKPPIVFRKRSGGSFSIKVQSSQLASTVETIRETYRKYYPMDSFDYYFLSEAFDKQYQSEKQLGWMLTISSTLAMLIALLGLYGLSAYLTLQRMKEVSIHKIHGASIYQLLYLLSKDLVKLVLFAGLLSIPIAYWIMEVWIEDFAFRIGLNLFFFILPLLLIGITALLTVGYHCLKVARLNPVSFLRAQ